MIVPMRKISAILYHGCKDELLAGLQHLGVVHIEQSDDKEAAAMHHRVESLREAMRARDALAALNAAPATVDGAVPRRDGAAVLEAYRKLSAELDDADDRLGALQTEVAAMEPWGDFDPKDIERLRANGVDIRFFSASPKQWAKLNHEAYRLARISHHLGEFMFVALFLPGEDTAIAADEVRLPAGSLGQLRAAAAEARKEHDALRSEMRTLAAGLPALDDLIASMRNEHMLLTAGESFDSHGDGAMFSFTGYFPAASEKKIVEFINRHPVACEIRGPASGDKVPVLMKNGWFARKFEPILKLLSLPSYTEIDPVPFFAPFLVVFIALCLGDAGYGLIFLAVSIAGLFLAPVRLRPVFETTTVISIVVIIAGAALNSCFGNTLFGGPGIPAGSAFLPSGAQWLSPLSPMSSDKGTIYPMMSFAIVLGIIQVFLAITLRIVNAARQQGWRHAIFPFSFFPIFFGFLVSATHSNFLDLNMAGFSVGGWKVGQWWQAVPAAAGNAMFIGGWVLFLFFNNPDSNILLRPLRGLWEAFNFITGMLSSILSYLRLFALGLSSGLLGMSFNDMAARIASIGGDAPDWLSLWAIPAILLLIVGHSINIGLSIISAIIHPLRLTFVEFLFNNLAFTGGGREFKPLKKTEQPY